MNFSILLIYTLASTTEPFNAEKAFLALSVVNILRFPLTMIPFVITGVIQVRKDQEYSGKKVHFNYYILQLSVVNILCFPLTMIPFVITGVVQVRKDQEYSDKKKNILRITFYKFRHCL